MRTSTVAFEYPAWKLMCAPLVAYHCSMPRTWAHHDSLTSIRNSNSIRVCAVRYSCVRLLQTQYRLTDKTNQTSHESG